MTSDPTSMINLLVGLGEVELVRINDSDNAALGVVMQSRRVARVCVVWRSVCSEGYRRSCRWTCPPSAAPLHWSGGNGAGCARTRGEWSGRSSNKIPGSARCGCR